MKLPGREGSECALVASRAADRPRVPALFERAARWLGQRLCGLRGHDAVLHFEGKWMLMRCTSCGHDTPGWSTEGAAPRQRFGGDPRRHALKTPLRVVRKSA